MKKVLKIAGIAVVALLALLIIIPIAFSGTIEEIVKKEINKMLDAEVDYDDFSLSIFSSFPDLRAGLDGLSVVGKGRFANDTLAYVGSFKADIDIMSALSGDIDINAIIVDNLKAKAIVAADSTANWDIVAATDTTATVEEADTTQSTLKLSLDVVEVNHANIAYIDSTSKMAAYVNDLNLALSGDIDADITMLELALGIGGIDVVMDDIKYLKGVTVDFDANIEADLANNKYTFKDNTLDFNGVPLSFDGYAQLKDSSTVVDMKLAANETSFKTILALVPEYILKDVQGLQTDGSLELYADVNGEYIDMEHIPALDVVFKVNNGKIQYPDLPKALNNINIDVAVKNPGGPADLTTVDVNKLHIELGSNPFDAGLNLKTPISNPTFGASLNGTIDLNSLKEALPLDSMTIAGIIKANLSVATDMKAIEKEDYESIKANGTVNLSGFSVEGNVLPQGFNISEANLNFTPKYLELNPMKATLGSSDFDVTGKLESYLAYALKDSTIKGTLTLKSNLIDCNELMSLAGDETAAPADSAAAGQPDTPAETAESAAVEIPKNINFKFNTAINKLIYDKLNIDNIRGDVAVKDGIAQLSGLKLDLCEGTASLTGKYSSANIEKPYIDMDINLNNVNINSLTNSFSTVDSLLPIAKSAQGKVTIGLAIESELDNQMSLVLPTTNGKGNFQSESIGLKDSDFQKKLSALLKNDKYNEMTLKDCSFDFTIKDGNIVVEPFKMKMFGKETTFSGKQGLDQTMDYVLSIPIARSEIASLAGGLGLNNLPASGNDIPVGIAIKGTLTKPSLGLDLDEAKNTVVEETKAVVQEKIEEAKEEAIEKATEKIKEELKDNEKVQDGLNKLNNLFKRK